MSIACKYCIATKGLRLDSLWVFETEEELYNHIEMEHDIPVARKGETEEETMVRFQDKNPRAGGPDCRCPACMAKRGDARLALVDETNIIKGE